MSIRKSAKLYKMLLTAEFESRSQYPELRISFIVIPCPLWPASLWWCFISKSVIFPAFCNNIGYLHSLSRNNFSNLPPTWIISFTSKNGSKRKILLLLSSDLFKSLEFSTDFNHWSLILKLHCCAIFINIVFVPCSKLVLSKVALFTFLMMPCWLILDNRITLNLITSATTLTILNQSDFDSPEQSKHIQALWRDTKHILSSIQDPFCWLEVLVFSSFQVASGSQRNCGPRYYVLTLSHYKSQSLLTHNLLSSVLNWYSATGIHLNDLSSILFATKCFEPFLFVPNLSQYNLTISPEYFFVDRNFQFFPQKNGQLYWECSCH